MIPTRSKVATFSVSFKVETEGNLLTRTLQKLTDHFSVAAEIIRSSLKKGKLFAETNSVELAG